MTDREGPIQRAIVEYLRLCWPHAIVHHAKGEIKQRGKNIARELHQAKVNGAVTGFPDLVVIGWSKIPVLFFEVKAPGNYPSPAQREVHAQLERLGHKVAVVRSIEDVQEALARWRIWGRLPLESGQSDAATPD
jgi:hypothetical protein